MSYRGDFALGSTFDLKFTTRQFSTGAPFTLAGTPVISAYPDNSITQLTAGITLTVDFDSVTGLNNVRMVATSGNGYAAGSNYDLVITTGTVDSVSVVGEVIGSFSIEARSGLRPTVAGRTLDVSAGGEGGVDWANVGSPTTTVGLSGTTVKTATDVETDTADIQSRLPAALVSGRIDASIGAVAAGAITAAGFAAGALDAVWSVATRLLTAGTNIVLAKGTGVTGFNDLSAAQVNAEVDTAIADARLDELLAADSDIDGAAPPTVGSVFHELLTKSAAGFTYDQTTDSLEAVRDNMGTAQTGDSFARLGAPAGVSVSADIAAVKSDTAAILVDTADMQPKLGTPAGASISADIAAIEAQTDDIGTAGAGLTAIPWNAAWDAEVQSEVTDALNVYDPPTNTEMVTAFTEIKGATWSAVTDTLELIRDKETDIETDTQDIQTKVGTPAGASVSADVAAVKVDTAAILVDTGTTLDGRIPAALVGGRMDSSLGEIAVGVDLSATMKTSVNTEVLDVLNTDTFAEPGQEAPPATTTLVTKIGYLYKAFRNRMTHSATEIKLYADDAVTVDQKSTHSDDGTTYDRTEFGTGP